MPRQVRMKASASCSRLLLLFTLSRRAMSWLSMKVTRSLPQVKLPFSAVSVLSISLNALEPAKTLRMAVLSGKSSSDIPLRFANL